MADSARVPLSSNLATTLVSLNAALATLAAAGKYAIASPVDLGDALEITGSALPAPGFWTGVYFDGLAYTTMRLGPQADVDTFMATLPRGFVVLQTIPTRFGYALFLVTNVPSLYGSNLFTFDAGDVTSSTNSAGFQTYINQVTGILPIGTYKVHWQHETRNNVVTSICEVAVSLDAVEIGKTAILGPGTGQFCAQSGFKVQAFGSATTHTLLVQWRSSPGGGANNAQIRRGRLTVYRVL